MDDSEDKDPYTRNLCGPEETQQLKIKFEERTRQEEIRDHVLAIRLGCQRGLVDLSRLIKRHSAWSEGFKTLAICSLRASFPWKDSDIGWYAFRDQVVQLWPVEDTTMRREMHGLLDFPPPQQPPNKENPSDA